MSPPKSLAFTCGDPAGIGATAAVAAARAVARKNRIVPLFVGEKSAWSRAGWRRADGPLLDTNLGVRLPSPGRPSADGGRVSAASFERALTLCARGLASGVVTAPIAKEWWAAAGYGFVDHTERLARCSDSGKAEMVLGIPSRRLWCALATRHLPLEEAVRRLDAESVLGAAAALDAALRALERSRPRLAVCALNPHAGEGGLIGSDEKNWIVPALREARRRGLSIAGPLPADSAWRLHVEGAFDGLVCLYHDQALIPLKALGGLSGVNWTIGLPFVRTSPAHGTAWDAARSGRVDPTATIEAARLAARLL